MEQKIELNDQFVEKLKRACERRNAWDFYGRIGKFFPAIHSTRRDIGKKIKVDIGKVDYSLADMKNMAFVFYKDLRSTFFENIKKALIGKIQFCVKLPLLTKWGVR